MGTADLLQMLNKTTGGHVRSENFWSLGPWKRLGDLPKCDGGRVSLSAGCLMFNGEEYDHPTSSFRSGSTTGPYIGLGWSWQLKGYLSCQVLGSDLWSRADIPVSSPVVPNLQLSSCCQTTTPNTSWKQQTLVMMEVAVFNNRWRATDWET